MTVSAAQRARQKAWREAKIEAGYCGNCARVREIAWRVTCEVCRRKAREAAKEVRKKKRQDRLEAHVHRPPGSPFPRERKIKI